MNPDPPSEPGVSFVERMRLLDERFLGPAGPRPSDMSWNEYHGAFRPWWLRVSVGAILVGGILVARFFGDTAQAIYLVPAFGVALTLSFRAERNERRIWAEKRRTK